MSIRAMNWAYEQIEATDLTAKAAQVFAALAWFHNQDTGRCDPSVAKLVARTKLSERGVRLALRELEEKKLLSTTHRQQRTGRGKKNLTSRYAFRAMPQSGAQDAGTVGHGMPPKEQQTPSTFSDLAMVTEEEDFQPRIRIIVGGRA